MTKDSEEEITGSKYYWELFKHTLSTIVLVLVAVIVIEWVVWKGVVLDFIVEELTSEESAEYRAFYKEFDQCVSGQLKVLVTKEFEERENALKEYLGEESSQIEMRRGDCILASTSGDELNNEELGICMEKADSLRSQLVDEWIENLETLHEERRLKYKTCGVKARKSCHENIGFGKFGKLWFEHDGHRVSDEDALYAAANPC